MLTPAIAAAASPAIRPTAADIAGPALAASWIAVVIPALSPTSSATNTDTVKIASERVETSAPS